MHVWLLTLGEPVPGDGQSADRLHRTGRLAEYLGGRGHEVTWWTSNVDHVRKRTRKPIGNTGEQLPGVKIVLLEGRLYSRNVSLDRILHHRDAARGFARGAEIASPPDVVLCSLPTLEMADAATRYGRARGIPVVLDVRDLWPDIIVDVAPAAMRPLARLALLPMFRQLHRSVRGATAIVGTSPAMVQWALDGVARPRSALDVAFPLSYDRLGFKREDIPRSPLTGCFIGTLGRRIDLSTVIRSARQLHAERPGEFRFEIVGAGEMEQDLRREAVDLPNVAFWGWQDQEGVRDVLLRSDVGLLPYPRTFDFRRNWPNKVAEYCAAGLPIISSLDGVTGDLIKERGCGMLYPPGDNRALVEALLRMRGNRNIVREMSSASESVHTTLFDSGLVLRQMESYLMMLSSRTDRPGGVG